MEIQPLIGANGQAIGALGLMFRQSRTAKKQRAHMVDLTASLLVSAVMQARLRRAAERQRLEAEQHGRAKVQLMARLSHELRTPLQSIAGYIELLRLGAPEPLTPAQAYLLDRMLDGEQILVHVVDDLITFSRLETGHLSYDLDAVSVNQALRVTEAIVAPLAHARGVALSVSDGTRDAQVFGDDAKIKQVLVNLATNAVKFTGQGGQVDAHLPRRGRRRGVRHLRHGRRHPGRSAARDLRAVRAAADAAARQPRRIGAGAGDQSRVRARRCSGELTVSSTLRTRLDVHAPAQAILTRARCGTSVVGRTGSRRERDARRGHHADARNPAHTGLGASAAGALRRAAPYTTFVPLSIDGRQLRIARTLTRRNPR